jgi:hypothetical protein
MAVRAKMKLVSVMPQVWGGAQAMFQCQYNEKLNEEDVGFSKATPSGEARFSIDNPQALAQLVIGEDYYFDISPAQ